jgi:hypothetical protein
MQWCKKEEKKGSIKWDYDRVEMVGWEKGDDQD